mgnify:CR=1 FL=1
MQNVMKPGKDNTQDGIPYREKAVAEEQGT